MKRIRSKSPTWYRKKCVEWAKIQAKERDGWTCQYCERTRKEGWQIQGSHILPEGAYPMMSHVPDNIIALCAQHHLSGANSRMGSKEPSWHGDPMLFAEWFNKKWPGRYQDLLNRSHNRPFMTNWKKEWETIKAKS